MAAAAHCGATWVYSLDITDFFPTTSAQRVTAALEGIGYPRGAALLISAFCCYEGSLAQGSPASPVLSNLVFGPSDERLKQIAVETGSRVTRYADDVVFSGTGEIPVGLETRVRSVITDAGWAIAREKEHFARLPHRLKVHGLLVQGTEPRLTQGYRNRIRAISHLTKSEKVRGEVEILDVDQPKISALRRGKLSGFSLDRLVRFLVLLGSDVQIVVKEQPRSRRRARLLVA